MGLLLRKLYALFEPWSDGTEPAPERFLRSFSFPLKIELETFPLI